MEQNKVTIHDIAALLGLSASTVSRALSDHPRISEETKERVFQKARELNYHPNKLASKLRNGKGNSIGVIVPRINRDFFSNAISGMESITNPAGYSLMICQTNEDFESEMKGLQSLANNQVDGILMSISAQTRNSLHIQKAILDGIRIVQFDRVSPDLDLCQVLNDNFEGAYQLTRHLLRQGHRRIFHYSGPLHINIYQDRFSGYQKALEEAGLFVETDWLYQNILTREQGAEVTRELFEQGRLPEAVFAASDYAALGARTTLMDLDIQMAQKLEIAGFGNEPFTELLQPGMTTVEQFPFEMGQKAAKLLIDSIEANNPGPAREQIEIKTKLIIRK